MAEASATRQRLPLWKRLLLVAGLVVMGPCVGARCAGVEGFEAEGPAMQPTLCNEDRFFVERLTLGLHVPFTSIPIVRWGSPDLGDIVVVRAPADGITIVKRVIGVGDDTIEIRDDIVYRNGTALGVGTRGVPGVPEQACRDESLGDARWSTLQNIASVPSNYPAVVIPEGHVYVLGDHRDRSNDSRFFGTVPAANVVGRYLGTYWQGEPPELCPRCP